MRKILFYWILVVLVSLFVVPVASAGGGDKTVLIYYISSSGSDDNPCTLSEPCATTSGALVNVIEEGDIDVPEPMAEFLTAAGGLGIFVFLIAQLVKWIAMQYGGEGVGGKAAAITVAVGYAGLFIASQCGVDVTAIGISTEPIALALQATISFLISVGVFKAGRLAGVV